LGLSPLLECIQVIGLLEKGESQIFEEGKFTFLEFDNPDFEDAGI